MSGRMTKEIGESGSEEMVWRELPSKRAGAHYSKEVD